jgi:hypothetical protein
MKHHAKVPALPRNRLFVAATVLLFTAIVFGPRPAFAQERKPVAEVEFQRRFDEWRQAPNDSERMHRAHAGFFPRGVSSQQVKRMAQSITNEDSRIEFAAEAYPFTVDPENFYDVYDAFQTFSKVFRLHDRILAMHRPTAQMPAPVMMPAPLTEKEMADILASLRKEPFDDSKLGLAKVIGGSARGRMTSKQVTEMLKLFSFDDRRLDCAKLAFDWVIDPVNFHIVYDTFSFDRQKGELTRYIEARRAKERPGKGR